MFTGYSDKTVDFFWDIRFNNSREWFHPRKDQFNAYIMDPTKALSGELYDWLTEKYPPAAPESAHLENLPRCQKALRQRSPQGPYLVFIPERAGGKGKRALPLV